MHPIDEAKKREREMHAHIAHGYSHVWGDMCITYDGRESLSPRDIEGAWPKKKKHVGAVGIEPTRAMPIAVPGSSRNAVGKATAVHLLNTTP